MRAPVPARLPARPLAFALAFVLGAGALLPWARPAGAQVVGEPAEGLSVGVFVGGTALIGVLFEWTEGHRSVELSVGTWSFRDASVSVVGRQYFGASYLRPVVGLGLWAIAGRSQGGTGVTLLARAPVGFDWRMSDDHYLDLTLNVNQALWIRRADPSDDYPLNRRLVPLPGLDYRWRF